MEISKACGLFTASSAPLMLRHFSTSMMPRGTESCGSSESFQIILHKVVNRWYLAQPVLRP